LFGAGRSFAKRPHNPFNVGTHTSRRFLAPPGTRIFSGLVERLLGGPRRRTREDQHPCRRGSILHFNRRSDDCLPDRKSTLRPDLYESRASRDGNALRRCAQWDTIPATISSPSSSLWPLAVKSRSKCSLV